MGRLSGISCRLDGYHERRARHTSGVCITGVSAIPRSWKKRYCQMRNRVSLGSDGDVDIRKKIPLSRKPRSRVTSGEEDEHG